MSAGTFAVQGVSLTIDPGCAIEDLAADAACFADVIEDLAALGAQGSGNTENLFHAIRYLSNLTKGFANEIESRSPAA